MSQIFRFRSFPQTNHRKFADKQGCEESYPQAVKALFISCETLTATRFLFHSTNVHNCEFIAGDVLKVVDELEDKPDFIVLDPPRDGIHPKTVLSVENLRQQC